MPRTSGFYTDRAGRPLPPGFYPEPEGGRMTREQMLAESYAIDALCGCETGHVAEAARRLNALVRGVIEETVDPDPMEEEAP